MRDPASTGLTMLCEDSMQSGTAGEWWRWDSGPLRRWPGCVGGVLREQVGVCRVFMRGTGLAVGSAFDSTSIP